MESGDQHVPALSNWRAARSTERLQREFSDPDFDDSGWLPIDVPAHWQTQPGFEDFDGTLLYRADVKFPSLQPGQRRWLRFNGLCYTGDVFLDGVYVGETEGYYSHHQFEITDLANRSGSTVLGVEVGAPKNRDGEAKRTITGWFTEPPGAPLTWNPAGIWRRALVLDTGPVAIRNLRAICTAADDRRAIVSMRAVLIADAPADIGVVTEVADVSETTPFTVAAGENHVEWKVEVVEPELWWPHHLGEQPLHDLRVQVRVADGSISDKKSRRIGFRSTSMRDFILRVNGKRTFVRGVNVAPTEIQLALVPPETFRREIEAIRDAGFNLVRARSHVSRRDFYEACDELGMLVWQDMPLSGSYVRSVSGQVERQARDMVDQLGHHPSIVVWGGHYRPHTNEPRMTSTPNIRDQQMPSWNRTVLDRTVRRTLTGADPSRKVVVHSDVAPHVPHLSGSDLALYFGWFDGQASDIAEYAAALPRFVRFVSDMGPQALPARIEQDLDELFAVHGAEPDTLHAVVPAIDFAEIDDWLDEMRAYQASVLKTMIETLRVLKYRPVGGFCAGLWKAAGPGLSRALVDYDRTPRPALQAVTKALQPILPVLYPAVATIPARTTSAFSVHLCNDLTTEHDLTVNATIADQRGRSVRTWQGRVGADEVVFLDDLSVRGGRIGDVAVVTLDVSGGPAPASNTFRFVAS